MKREAKEIFFNDVFNKYYQKIVSYLFFYCRDLEISKDIAQDTFSTYWEHIDRVDNENSPLPYLYFVARNKMLNYLRREIVSKKYATSYKQQILEISYGAINSPTMANVQVDEIKECIEKSLNQMNSHTAETFVLSRYNGMKNSEIAQYSNISIKTVEYRLMSALRILRKNLKEFMTLIFLLNIV